MTTKTTWTVERNGYSFTFYGDDKGWSYRIDGPGGSLTLDATNEQDPASEFTDAGEGSAPHLMLMAVAEVSALALKAMEDWCGEGYSIPIKKAKT